ncbi:hypothetical protein [uncultured Shimia sp.]|uniref:hypothetical protein n=1 Tax=uncultured Shimia sp. TaxID=573152 RepID=UPI00262110C0|nr:hypothetical protein [uncultured Shimia sp.]
MPSVTTIVVGILVLVVGAACAEAFIKRNKRSSLSKIKPKSSEVRHHPLDNDSMDAIIAKNRRLEERNGKR